MKPDGGGDLTLGDDLRHALHAAGAVVSTADPDHELVLRIDGDIEAIMGYTAEDWIAADHRALIHPDDVDAYWLEPGQVVPGRVYDRTARFRHADGSWRWIREVAHVSLGDDGRPVMRGFFFDITRDKQHAAELNRLARTDPVTDLPNRLALAETLADSLATRRPVALLMIDLDRFKEVNDTFGHEAGDEMLVLVADRLRRALPVGAGLYRVGGDEYAVVVPGAAGVDDLDGLLHRLATDCSAPIEAWGIQLAMSMSVGVAFGGPDGPDESAVLLRRADVAMYAAKRAGGGARVYDAPLDESSTRRSILVGEFTGALRGGRIGLHFQPQVDLHTGAIVGCEGLARWDHARFGLLTPDAFLDVALMSETIADFTLAMIEQAAGLSRRATLAGHRLPVAVNVPMRALRGNDFADRVAEILAAAEVDESMLTVEITEGDVAEPSSAMLAVLDRLHQSGVQTAIDDFGTGHSSLTRLRAIQVDEVKVDRAFIERIVDDSFDRHIVGSVIALGAGLGYRVVAEGVEHRDQAELLRTLGCRIAQGHLFAAAMPADALLDRLEAGVRGRPGA